MSLLRFVPIKLMLFLVLGICVGHYFDIEIQTSLAFTIFFICILVFLFRAAPRQNAVLFGVVALLTTTSIGVLSFSLWNPKHQQQHYSHQNLKQDHEWQIKIREVLKSSTYSHRYYAQVLSLDNKIASGKILVSVPIDSTSIKMSVDTEILVFAKLSNLKKPLNPHQFDYKKYLEGLGIYHQLRLKPNTYIPSKSQNKTILGLAASARSIITEKLKQTAIGSEELEVIQALLLGQRSEISDNTYTNYKNAGAVHILAVSGLHIGVLLLLLQFLLKPIELLPKGKIIKLFIIVLLLWCFALLAGFSASVVRAVTMFSFVAYALYLNRPSNTFNILALSMFFILLVINPMLLFQAGFQMSYAAVFSIVWLYPLLQKLWFPKNVILKKIWQLLAVSLAAQLGVLPISLFYFHQFPGLFFISNLLIVPFLGIVLGMGILVIVLALCNCLPLFLANWYNALVGLMNAIVQWVAEQEAFIFQNISFDIVQLVLMYLMIIAAVLFFNKPTFKRTSVLLTSIELFQLWLLYCNYTTKNTEHLVVAHQTKNSVLLHQKGSALEVISTSKNRASNSIKDYQIAERTTKINHDTIQNSYVFKGKTILVLDSVGMYLKQPFDIIILTQSSKINLERVLDATSPKLLIADGSNYHSTVQRWKETAAKRKLPFHYTAEKGAYYFE